MTLHDMDMYSYHGGEWLSKRGFLPHKNEVFAGTPYSPLFGFPCHFCLLSSNSQGVLEGRSPSKETIFPLPLIKGKGDRVDRYPL